jgi:hypothetical protein
LLPDAPQPKAMINVNLILSPGIDRAHRKLAKRDKRTKHVYEAWKLAQNLADDADYNGGPTFGNSARAVVRGEQNGVAENGTALGGSASGTESEGGEVEQGLSPMSTPDPRSPTTKPSESTTSFGQSRLSFGGTVGTDQLSDDWDEDDTQSQGRELQKKPSAYKKWREHTKALHERVSLGRTRSPMWVS